jgi:imidazolonepropionase-like amidohydrolase
LIALLCLIPGALGALRAPLVFTHVTLIDATGQPALPDRTVVVAGDRILAIGATGKLRLPRNARVVNAKGKYLIPGLWDMHVHLRGGPELIPDNEASLTVFVANGIVGIREMGGDIAPTVFRWRKEIADGTRLGPRILSAGRKIEGPAFYWAGSYGVGDPESARRAVRELKAMGADFVKIYSTDFLRGTFSALIDEAKQQNLSVVGHLPLLTHTVRDCIDAGVKSIEHIEFHVLPGCSRSEWQLPYFGNELLFHQAESFDPEWTQDLIARMVQRDVWVTPTLAAVALAVEVGHLDYSQHPQRRYVFPGIWRSWDQETGLRHPYPGIALKQWELVHEKGRLLLKMLQAGGVGLLAGSDCGASNNFTFPGWILHRELAMMVEAGLTPMQALQAATRNPARFLGELDRSGTVETGKTANLVLLNANPLEDIRNTEKIDSVVLRGTLLSRTDLDRLLDGVAAAAARKRAALDRN